MGRAKKTAAKRPSGTKAIKDHTASGISPQTAGPENGGPADKAVAIDRRTGQDRRKTPDRRKQNLPVAVERRKLQRRAKVNRRRQIDPTTCERDYTADEIEFMNALDQYKRTSGRMFPTCSEILEVIRKLGYEKRPTPVVQDPLALPAIPVADIFCPARSG